MKKYENIRNRGISYTNTGGTFKQRKLWDIARNIGAMECLKIHQRNAYTYTHTHTHAHRETFFLNH